MITLGWSAVRWDGDDRHSGEQSAEDRDDSLQARGRVYGDRLGSRDLCGNSLRRFEQAGPRGGLPGYLDRVRLVGGRTGQARQDAHCATVSGTAGGRHVGALDVRGVRDTPRVLRVLAMQSATQG